MPEDAQGQAPLPIDSLVPEIVAALSVNNSAVIVAPPGAGKTTRIPPALAGEERKRGEGEREGEREGEGRRRQGAVVLLQPRRVAARAAAARIAEERGWRLGEEVGYHIRFDRRIGPRTRVRVLTEGILARQIQSDPYLEGVGCVILDEFHERSIHTDLALAMLREIQTTVREDLRIVVMSATMDPAPIAKFLGGAPIFQGEGRLHPIEIEYLEKPTAAPIWEQAAAAGRRALAAPAKPGEPDHVLVFLPGMGEIRRTESLIQSDAARAGAEIHLLHSAVSGEAQDRALRPSARRKIVLATNIAETSITIDGVRTVIDSGLARVAMVDARLGIDRLELRRISRASADQRAGRAGRTGPGRCLRLWTRAEDNTLEPREAPEIHRVDLTGTALAVKAHGARDLAQFGWFEPPRPDALARAARLLEMLGATDKNGTVTPLGRRLAALPLHPRIGRLLIAGAEAGLLREAATLAAMLSEKDILADARTGRRRAAKHEGLSDLLDRLDLLEDDPRSPEFDPQAVRAVERVRDDLMDAAKRLGLGKT